MSKSNYVTSKTVVTRPTISIPFKDSFPDLPGPKYAEYIRETYINTGKMLSASDSISEDLLTLTINVVWKDDAERLAYRNDPIVEKCFEFMIDYRKRNGMTMDWFIKEYDGETNTVISERSGSFI
jgi:hypothetical protein